MDGKEVLSVYSRLSDICLSDILDKIEAEAPLRGDHGRPQGGNRDRNER
jgi:hypothetical protein